MLKKSSVMAWVRVSESKLPAVLAIGAVVIGVTTLIGVATVMYAKGAKKGADDQKKRDEPETDIVKAEPTDDELYTEGVAAAVTEVTSNRKIRACVAVTIGVAYLAYKVKYAPVNDWGQLCYRTNEYNLAAANKYYEGLIELLRRCADGVPKFTEAGNEDAAKALSYIAGNVNGIINNVSRLEREHFGYTL